MPNISIDRPNNEQIKPQYRTLQQDQVEGRSIVDGEYGKLYGHEFGIDEVLDLNVESNLYEPESDQVKISNFTLTRLTERALDVHVEFKMPSSLTSEIVDPD